MNLGRVCRCTTTTLLSLLFALTLTAQDTLSVAMPAAATAADTAATFTVGVLTKEAADSAYAAEDYARAASLYAALIAANGESPEIYFNLGNAYYRQDSLARAILYYERSLLLNPADADTRFNLELARAKTVDKVVPQTEFFFVSAMRTLLLALGPRAWTWCGWLAFALMLLLAAVYLFVPRVGMQKAAFAAAVVSMLVCVMANVAAFTQRSQLRNRTGAVVMTPSALVKSTPSRGGTDLFILHEGTHVDITDNTMRQWVEIRMADGKTGWMERSSIEVI